jgi:hypothetical protein
MKTSHHQARSQSFFDDLAEQVPDMPREALERGFLDAVRRAVPGGSRMDVVVPIRATHFREVPRRPSRLVGQPWRSEPMEKKAA